MCKSFAICSRLFALRSDAGQAAQSLLSALRFAQQVKVSGAAHTRCSALAVDLAVVVIVVVAVHARKSFSRS